MTVSSELVMVKLGAKKEVAKALEDVIIKCRIATAVEKSHFIGQMYVESNGFQATVESLNYSVEGLLKNFGRHRISLEDVNKYGRIDKIINGKKVVVRPANQEMLANLLYGGPWGLKYLGNKVMGDGWKYRGRGYKQLTGLANYLAYSMATYGDDRIVRNPDLLLQIADATKSAGWFWVKNKLSAIAVDTKDSTIERLTTKVNGGDKGLALRKTMTREALRLFQTMTAR